jgi:hypothetical protein
MTIHPINLALLALIVAMVIYQGRLYLLHRLTYRLGFLAFWVLLGVEMLTGEQSMLLPAAACLLYGIWKRRRLGKDLARWMERDGAGGEASL